MSYINNILGRGKNLRTLVQFVVGILFSGLFLYLFLKNFNYTSVIGILSELSYYNILGVLLATIAHLWAKAIRWRIIITPLKKIALVSSFANISIGIMANNLLPARSGELVRVLSLSKTEEISASSIFSALILERLLDGYILLLFFMISSYHINLVQAASVMPILRKTALMAFILFSGILLTLMLFYKYGASNRLEKLLPQKFHLIIDKLEEFKTGLDILKDFKRMIWICSWSAVVWLLTAFIILSTLRMFTNIQPDIFTHIGPVESIFLNGAVSLALILPSAPGFFGSFHLACSLVMMGFGLSKVFSDSFAIFLHGSQYTLTTVIGLIFFIKSHLKLKIKNGFNESEKCKAKNV